MYRVGEFARVDVISRAQGIAERPFLVGTAYVPIYVELLNSNLSRLRPEVIALGNSRVLQFRSRFFKPTKTFYNAGGTVGLNAKIYADFLENLPSGYQPEIVIFGLEQSEFASQPFDVVGSKPILHVRLRELKNQLLIFVSATRNFYIDLFNRKFSFATLYTPDTNFFSFGINARVNRNGYRSDGSYFFGKFMRDPDDPYNDDYKFKKSSLNIEVGRDHFKHAAHVHPEALVEVDKILSASADRGIKVVGFFPPYPQELYQKMLSLGDRYGYLNELYPAVAPIFKKYGFKLYNFSDSRAAGASDDKAIDGLHLSERTALRMFLIMAKDDPKLAEYAEDLTFLSDRLSQAPNPYDVFRFEF